MSLFFAFTCFQFIHTYRNSCSFNPHSQDHILLCCRRFSFHSHHMIMTMSIIIISSILLHCIIMTCCAIRNEPSNETMQKRWWRREGGGWELKSYWALPWMLRFHFMSPAIWLNYFNCVRAFFFPHPHHTALLFKLENNNHAFIRQRWLSNDIVVYRFRWWLPLPGWCACFCFQPFPWYRLILCFCFFFPLRKFNPSHSLSIARLRLNSCCELLFIQLKKNVVPWIFNKCSLWFIQNDSYFT